MGRRLRDATSDILIGAVVVLVAYWLLRSVFRVIAWGATLVVMAILVVVVLRIASKLRS